MAGARLLNPYVKVFLCIVGTLVMGYSLYPMFPSGLFDDAMTMVRGLVFLGFAYLLVVSLMDIVRSTGGPNKGV